MVHFFTQIVPIYFFIVTYSIHYFISCNQYCVMAIMSYNYPSRDNTILFLLVLGRFYKLALLYPK